MLCVSTTLKLFFQSDFSAVTHVSSLIPYRSLHALLHSRLNLCADSNLLFSSCLCVAPTAPSGCLESGHSAMVNHRRFDNAMSSSLLDSNMRLPHRYKTFTSSTQYHMVLTTLHKLQESGFYWGAITGKEANAMLAQDAAGTFLIRDSSDNRHLFTLSVKTALGTKNLRILCDTNSFYLQTDPKNVQSVPHFDCVLKLIHYFMSQSKGNARGGGCYIYSGGDKVPLELVKPLSLNLSTLQHLCRKTVNGHLDISSRRDQLPHPLKEFLQEYDAPI